MNEIYSKLSPKQFDHLRETLGNREGPPPVNEMGLFYGALTKYRIFVRDAAAVRFRDTECMVFRHHAEGLTIYTVLFAEPELDPVWARFTSLKAMLETFQAA